MKNKISDLLFLAWPCYFILGIFAFPLLSLYLFFVFLAISIFTFLIFIHLPRFIWSLSLGAILFSIGGVAAHLSVYNLPQVIERSGVYDFQSMQIVQIEPKDSKKSRYLLKIAPNQFIQVTSSYLQSEIKHCDIIHGRVYLNRPSKAITPTGFDLSQYAKQKKIIGYGWSLAKFTPTQSQTKNLTCQINHLRFLIFQRLKQHFSEQSLALSSALLIGYKAALSTDIKNSFKSLGLSHVLVISGLHVSLVSLFFFNLFRFIFALVPVLYRYYNIKSLAAFLAIGIVIFYGLIAGYQAATLRAAIMVIYALMAIIAHRPIFSFRTFSLALMSILLINPQQLYMAGFQLSFLAVFGIILCNKLQFFKQKIAHNIFITSFIILWLAPITFYYFGFTSLIGLAFNLLILPLLTFIILPFLFLGQLMPFLWDVNDYLFRQFFDFIEKLSLENFIYATAQPHILGIFAFYTGFSLSLLIYIYFTKRKSLLFVSFIAVYGLMAWHIYLQKQKLSHIFLIYEGPSLVWRSQDKLHIHYFETQSISNYNLLQIKQFFGFSPYAKPIISYGEDIDVKGRVFSATRNYTYLKGLCFKADILISPYSFRCQRGKALHLRSPFSSSYYQLQPHDDYNQFIIKYFNK